jgi:polysaccharide export outer membrane protein
MIRLHPSLLRSVRAFALTLLAVFLALPAAAQFNGPGSQTGSPEINRPVTLTTDPAVLYPATHELELGAGDLITLRVFGQSDYIPTVRIGTDGNVLLPLVGVVHLGGLSLTAAEQLIQTRLIEAGIYRDPQVTIQITEGPSAVATIIGEAHGIVPIIGSKRLLDVLTTIGGLPATASHVITINRNGVAQPIVIDLGSDPLRSQLANIPIFAGDTIVISRIGIVYVLGAFKTPGTIALNPYTQLTLMQATALSGGLAFEGKYDDLRVIRTINGQRTVVKIDVKKVLYGKAPDPILEPNDIVFLPSSTIKASINNGSLNSVFGLVGIIIALSYR